MAEIDQWKAQARLAAIANGIDPRVYLNLIGAESTWNPNAVSPRGAIGLAQFMPDTARGYGINPYDPIQSLYAGAKYLRNSLNQFNGNYEQAIASYNAGPNAVQRWIDTYGQQNWREGYNEGPDYTNETKPYVNKILGSAGGGAPGSNNMNPKIREVIVQYRTMYPTASDADIVAFLYSQQFDPADIQAAFPATMSTYTAPGAGPVAGTSGQPPRAPGSPFQPNPVGADYDVGPWQADGTRRVVIYMGGIPIAITIQQKTQTVDANGEPTDKIVTIDTKNIDAPKKTPDQEYNDWLASRRGLGSEPSLEEKQTAMAKFYGTYVAPTQSMQKTPHEQFMEDHWGMSTPAEQARMLQDSAEFARKKAEWDAEWPYRQQEYEARAATTAANNWNTLYQSPYQFERQQAAEEARLQLSRESQALEMAKAGDPFGARALAMGTQPPGYGGTEIVAGTGLRRLNPETGLIRNYASNLQAPIPPPAALFAPAPIARTTIPAAATPAAPGIAAPAAPAAPTAPQLRSSGGDYDIGGTAAGWKPTAPAPPTYTQNGGGSLAPSTPSDTGGAGGAPENNPDWMSNTAVPGFLRKLAMDYQTAQKAQNGIGSGPAYAASGSIPTYSNPYASNPQQGVGLSNPYTTGYGANMPRNLMPETPAPGYLPGYSTQSTTGPEFDFMRTLQQDGNIAPYSLPGGSARMPGIQAQNNMTPTQRLNWQNAVLYQGVPGLQQRDLDALMARTRQSVGAGFRI